MKSIPNGDKVFNVTNVFVMCVVIAILLGPFWFALVGSLDQGLDYLRGGVYFWPRVFTWANYEAVFSESGIYRAFLVTAERTVVGTILPLFFTALVAYGMSKTELKGRKIYTLVMLFTMFFGGGLIPTYLLYQKLHLLNNFWVYVIPWLFSVWNMIIIRSFIQSSISTSLIESAKMDGASEYRIFFSLVLPLSKPVLAAIGLFTAVAQWNSYQDSLFYTTSNSLQTLQLLLYNMITNADTATQMSSQAAQVMPNQAMQISPQTLELAMMMAAAAPILIVYPFLQKYFVKGMYIGSVKG